LILAAIGLRRHRGHRDRGLGPHRRHGEAEGLTRGPARPPPAGPRTWHPHDGAGAARCYRRSLLRQPLLGC
jgi:hypothetical protein